MPIKSVKMKISKNKKMCFFLMSQRSLNPKIRFLGQKIWPVARSQRRTHRVTTEGTLSGFQDFSFNLSSRIGPIITSSEVSVMFGSFTFSLAFRLSAEPSVSGTDRWSPTHLQKTSFWTRSPRRRNPRHIPSNVGRMSETQWNRTRRRLGPAQWRCTRWNCRKAAAASHLTAWEIPGPCHTWKIFLLNRTTLSKHNLVCVAAWRRWYLTGKHWAAGVAQATACQGRRKGPVG